MTDIPNTGKSAVPGPSRSPCGGAEGSGCCDDIGRQLVTLNNAIRRQIESCAGFENARVSMANGYILIYLNEHSGEDVFQRDIESHFGVTRSTTSKILGLMEDKGLIKRQTVETDARLRKLTLTEQGRRVLDCMAAGRRAVEAKLTAGFTPEETARLHDYLARMKKNIDSL